MNNERSGEMNGGPRRNEFNCLSRQHVTGKDPNFIDPSPPQAIDEAPPNSSSVVRADNLNTEPTPTPQDQTNTNQRGLGREENLRSEYNAGNEGARTQKIRKPGGEDP